MLTLDFNKFSKNLEKAKVYEADKEVQRVVSMKDEFFRIVAEVDSLSEVEKYSLDDLMFFIDNADYYLTGDSENGSKKESLVYKCLGLSSIPRRRLI